MSYIFEQDRPPLKRHGRWWHFGKIIFLVLRLRLNRDKQRIGDALKVIESAHPAFYSFLKIVALILKWGLYLIILFYGIILVAVTIGWLFGANF